RAGHVTGVQTCALPISGRERLATKGRRNFVSSQAFPPENVTLSAGQRKRLFVASCMALMTTAMVFSVRAATLDDLGAQFHVNKQLVGIFAGKAFLGFAAA